MTNNAVSDGERDTDRYAAIRVVQRCTTPTDPPVYGMPKLVRSWGPVTGSVDLQHSALLVAQTALKVAGMWPYGVPVVTGRYGRTLSGISSLLAANGVTLITDCDLGPQHIGMILYPTATIMMNARMFGDYVTTPRVYSALRQLSAMLFAAYLICPPYADALYLPLGFERDAGRDQLWHVWRTALWMSMEFLAPGPLVHALYEQGELPTIDPRQLIGYFRDPLFDYCAQPVRNPMSEQEMQQFPPLALRLAELSGLLPHIARVKQMATLKGVADAFSNERYLDYEREQDWFPFGSVEVAHAYQAIEGFFLRNLPPLTEYIQTRMTLHEQMSAVTDDDELLRRLSAQYQEQSRRQREQYPLLPPFSASYPR